MVRTVRTRVVSDGHTTKQGRIGDYPAALLDVLAMGVLTLFGAQQFTEGHLKMHYILITGTAKEGKSLAYSIAFQNAVLIG